MSSEKPVLATDWDDVNYEFLKHFFPYYNSQHNTEFQPSDVMEHNLSKLLGYELDYIMSKVDEFHEHGESVENGLMPTAEEVIPDLALSYDIVVVTARKKYLERRIQDMIECYLPGSIAEVYHAEDYEKYESKGAFVKALGAVALVDDHIDNIYSAVAHGVRGLLWNLPKNHRHPVTVERVSSWYEVYEKLTGKPFTPSSQPSEIDALSADPA